MMERYTALALLVFFLFAATSVNAAVSEFNAGLFLNISGYNVSSEVSDTNNIDANRLRFNFSANQSINGTIMWENTTSDAEFFGIRDDWTGWTNISTYSTGTMLAGTPEWVVMASSPLLGQRGVVTRDAANDVVFYTFNTSGANNGIGVGSNGGWNATTLTVAAPPGTSRNIGVAVENQSGRIMAVYVNQTNASGIQYIIWNGTDIIHNSSIPIGNSTITWEWIRLEAKPGSNEMLLLAQTDTIGSSGTLPDLYGAHWTGSTWDNITSLDNNTETGATQPFDLAFEWLTGDGLAVWGNASNTSLQSRTFNSTAGWSLSNQPVPFAQTALFNWVKLAPFPHNSTASGSNDIMACYYEGTADDIGCILWSGTAWKTGVELETAAEPGAATSRTLDVVGDPTTGGFIMAYIDNGLDVPTFKRCMNNSACSSGIAALWETYAAIFSLTDADGAWVTLTSNPNTEGQFIEMQKAQTSLRTYYGNFTCTSAVGSCTGSDGNVVSLGVSTALSKESYAFAFDRHSVLSSAVWFNSSSTTDIGPSATINYINATVQINATYKGNYTLHMYNWTNGVWSTCASTIVSGNTGINLTCKVCLTGTCDVNTDPRGYRASAANSRIVMLALNKTDDFGHPMNLNGTLEVDYVRFFIDYTTNTNITGLNVTYNATSVVAGDQLGLTAVGFDVDGTTNNSGGFNFTIWNATGSGVTYVSGNQSTLGVFNLTSNGTFAFNTSSFINSSAWNVSIAQNVTVRSDAITGINYTINTTGASTLPVAGDQVRITVIPFDRFGNLNFTGGFNFHGNNSGVTYVSGNGTATAVFNITRNGTFSFNVSSVNSPGVWNSTGENVTVNAATIVGLNFTYNATSLVAGGQIALVATPFDRFGNINFTGGANFTWANSTTTGSSYVSGNGSTTGVFNFTSLGTFAFNVSSSLNSSAWNVSLAQNVTVVAGAIFNITYSLNATSIVAGDQFLISATGLDVYGNTNTTGGFNYQHNRSGVTYVGGNGTASAVFNGTLNATYAFNVSAAYNSSVWNFTGPNVTVTSTTISGVNVTANASSVVAGSQVLLYALMFDRFGNLNFTGGANYSANYSGATQVGSNGSFTAVFNFTGATTFSFNVTPVLNLTAWNSTGDNITVTAGNIVALTIGFVNATTVVAGSQVSIVPVGLDVFGNSNSTGGFNFHGNESGMALVSGNGTSFGVFNLTHNGTWSYNASAVLNSSIWNSTGPNITVTSATIMGVNVSLNATSITAGGQVLVRALTFDRFGNLNFTGGGNYSLNNTAAGSQMGGNGSLTSAFQINASGTWSFNVSAALNGSAWNATGTNITVTAGSILGVVVSINASSIVAGGQLLVQGTGLDFYNNVNNTGGFNFHGNNSGVTYVSGNGTATAVFNITTNGTWSFNVSAVLNSSVWNATGPNITVTSDSIVGTNVTANATSVVAGGQVLLYAVMFDRFGNLNFTGGANYSANRTGSTQVDSNGSAIAVFNFTQNGTYSLNVTPLLNLTAWNATGPNVTVSVGTIVGLNFTYNATSLVAGSQLALSVTGFDRFGNVNFTGGFNYTWANSTTDGSSYVSGNESNLGVFNFTRNGTFAFNVSAFLNRSAWNVSIAQNATVSADYVTGVNLSYNATSIVAGNQLALTAVGFDRFGNMNNSGGFNYTPANATATGITYVGGNTTISGVFNLTANGTFAFNASSSLNGSAYNISTAQNVTVTSATISGVNVSLNATSLVAGDQFLVNAITFDRFGNLNFTGGSNYHGNASGITQVGSNGSLTAVFNLTRNGTWSLNVSAVLNSSAWNATGTNFTVTSANISGINVSINATSIEAGSQVLISAISFDRFGNLNFSGSFNYSMNASGAAQVGSNGSLTAVFNLTRNGTFAFNVSAPLALSVNPAWNSTGPNLTVGSSTIAGVNVSGYPTVSNSSVSQDVNGTFTLSIHGFDRFGNLNFTGGFNFIGANESIAGYVSGNSTNTGVYNTTNTGQVNVTVLSALNVSATNLTTLNSTVHPRLSGVSSGSITVSSATVSWSSHESATTLVEYGTLVSYGSNTTLADSPAGVAAHSALVSGLSASTTYHYRVHSCSVFNLCSFSSDATFATAGTATPTPSAGVDGGGGVVPILPTATTKAIKFIESPIVLEALSGSRHNWQFFVLSKATVKAQVKIIPTGSAAAWITLQQDTFILLSGERRASSFALDVPVDAAPGDYLVEFQLWDEYGANIGKEFMLVRVKKLDQPKPYVLKTIRVNSESNTTLVSITIGNPTNRTIESLVVYDTLPAGLGNNREIRFRNLPGKVESETGTTRITFEFNHVPPGQVSSANYEVDALLPIYSPYAQVASVKLFNPSEPVAQQLFKILNARFESIPGTDKRRLFVLVIYNGTTSINARLGIESDNIGEVEPSYIYKEFIPGEAREFVFTVIEKDPAVDTYPVNLLIVTEAGKTTLPFVLGISGLRPAVSNIILSNLAQFITSAWGAALLLAFLLVFLFIRRRKKRKKMERDRQKVIRELKR